MDTRDYFAGQAMNALIKNGEDHAKGKELKKLAGLAFRIADAMLAEREMLSHNFAIATSQADANGKAANKDKKPANGPQSSQ